MVVCRFVSLRKGLLGPIGTQKTGKKIKSSSNVKKTG